jgi:hypothetical protein
VPVGVNVDKHRCQLGHYDRSALAGIYVYLQSTKGHPIAIGAQVPSSRRGSGTLANVSLATSMSCS